MLTALKSSYRIQKQIRNFVPTKRLEICAAQFAHMMHMSKVKSLKGKVCLEVGTGSTLTHAVTMHLLGAKKVYATDLSRCFDERLLTNAVKTSIPSIVRDILSPFEYHEVIRSRVDNLLSFDTLNLSALEQLGVEYIAPVDFSKGRFKDRVNFVYSNSVLEHVCTDDVSPLLHNLTDTLTSGGQMLHCIHLEDHKDFERPFDFLCEARESFTRATQAARGNRIRSSEWKHLFASIEGLETGLFYEWERNKEVPSVIDPSIEYISERDLRVSHIGVYAQKSTV